MTDLTPEEADRQYNARAAIPEHPQIFERWRARSEAARGRLRCDPDYYYGPSPAETLDIFPSEARRAPLLLFLHGGYWRSLDKRDFAFLAPAFVDAGVSVAIINYGLAPQVTLPDIVRQTLRACAWTWRNCMGFGVDPDRIYAAGHSAGAQLAAMMLAAEWPTYARDLPPDLLRGALLVSGIYDLEPLVAAPFLKEDLRLDTEGARQLSPLRYRPRRTTRFYTAIGERESDEFQRQNRLIAAAWPECFVRDVPLPGCNHLTAIEQLGTQGSALFEAALEMMHAA